MRPIAIIIIEGVNSREVHQAAEAADLAARYYRRAPLLHGLEPRRRKTPGVSVLVHDRSGYTP